MVVVPVRLYPAIRKKAVRFHELDRAGRRVRHVRVSEPEGEWEAPSRPSGSQRPAPALRLEVERSGRADLPEAPAPEVAFEEVRKGYEVAPGQYVSMTREEVSALAPERSRVIDVATGTGSRKKPFKRPPMRKVLWNQLAAGWVSPTPCAVRITRRFTPCAFIASMQYFVPPEK